jgi:hypothetical protein
MLVFHLFYTNQLNIKKKIGKKKDREQCPGLKNKEANKSIMIFEPKRGFV